MSLVFSVQRVRVCTALDEQHYVVVVAVVVVVDSILCVQMDHPSHSFMFLVAR